MTIRLACYSPPYWQRLHTTILSQNDPIGFPIQIEQQRNNQSSSAINGMQRQLQQRNCICVGTLVVPYHSYISISRTAMNIELHFCRSTLLNSFQRHRILPYNIVPKRTCRVGLAECFDASKEFMDAVRVRFFAIPRDVLCLFSSVALMVQSVSAERNRTIACSWLFVSCSFLSSFPVILCSWSLAFIWLLNGLIWRCCYQDGLVSNRGSSWIFFLKRSNWACTIVTEESNGDSAVISCMNNIIHWKFGQIKNHSLQIY